MKLWILRPILDSEGNPPKPWREDPYGATMGLVVRAGSEEQARSLAMTVASGRANSGYGDASLSSCVELTPDGPAEVILDDTGTE